MKRNRKRLVGLLVASIVLSGATGLKANFGKDPFFRNDPFAQLILRSFFNPDKARPQIIKSGIIIRTSNINGKKRTVIINLGTGETWIIGDKNKNIKSQETEISENQEKFTFGKNTNQLNPNKTNPFEGFFGNPGLLQAKENQASVGMKYDKSKDTKKVTFDDIIGQDEAKEALKDAVLRLKNPDRSKKLGIKLKKGILLVGPPGTGKTQLARALANYAGCSFFYISAPEIESKWVGESAQNVKKLFKKASEQSPSIIFIDEMDSLGSRFKGHDSSDASKKPLLQFFTEMDGFIKKDKVVVVGATNAIENIDPALLRGGRFGKKVVVGTPNKKDRCELWKYYFSKHSPAEDVNNEYAEELSKRIRFIPNENRNITGADIEDIMSEAATIADKNEMENTSRKNIEAAISRYLYGQENKNSRTESQTLRLKFHEAAHLVTSRMCKSNFTVESISIRSQGNAEGKIIQGEEEDTPDYTKQRLMDSLSVMFAGRIGERISGRGIDPGAENDLMRAQRLATKMVTKLGMKSNEENKDILNPCDEDNKKEIMAIQKAAYLEAERILTEHKQLLLMFVKALDQKDELNKKEIEEIVSEYKSSLANK